MNGNASSRKGLRAWSDKYFEAGIEIELASMCRPVCIFQKGERSLNAIPNFADLIADPDKAALVPAEAIPATHGELERLKGSSRLKVFFVLEAMR